MAVSGVQTHTASVEAGLAFLDSGADFADGVIAHEGRQLGGDVFITFDKDAAAQTNRLGHAALLLR